MIRKELLTSIKDFCTLNELNPEDFINDLLQSAFTREKYGSNPIPTSKPTKVNNEPQIKKQNVKGDIYGES